MKFVAMKRVLRIEWHHFARWLLVVLGAGWMVGATWSLFFQTTLPPNSYFSYERQLANCRTKQTSQARYDCTSQLMLSKDNAIFKKTLIVLVPPLWVFGAYLVVNRIIQRRQEEKKSRAAVAASHKRMAEWQEFLRSIKSEAAAAQKQKAPAAAPVRPIATPSPLAKRQ